MSARTSDLILPAGLLVDRPVPEAVPSGSLYPGLDTQIIYRNNDLGTGWEEWLVIGDFSVYVSAEEVRDIVAALLKAGPGVTLTNSDETDELTVTVSLDTEGVRDTVGSLLVAGAGVTLSVDDTANTVTIGVSASVDAEVVRDLVGSTLVAGENVTITVDDTANTVTIDAAAGGGSGAGGGLFRGQWAADAIVYQQGFDGGSIPAPFTTSKGGNGTLPVVSTEDPATGGWTSSVKCATIFGAATDRSTLTLSLADLALTGVTRIKVWVYHSSGAVVSSGGDSSQAHLNYTRVIKNGVNAFSQQGAVAWQQVEVSVDSDDVLAFEAIGTGQGSNSVGFASFTGLEVYAAEAPYMLGEYVTHLGSLWRSTTDNNSTTPGSHASWVLKTQPGVLTLEANQTAANIPAGLPAGTLIVQKQA